MKADAAFAVQRCGSSGDRSMPKSNATLEFYASFTSHYVEELTERC